mgnify:FL=1
MEIEDILKEIGETFTKCLNEKSEVPASEVDKLRKEIEELKKENKQLRELAQKVLDSVDATNTKLREVAEERDNAEKRAETVKMIDEYRKKYYNEATTLRKKEAAYSKALGAIYGALEALKSELE